jgi:hypothetical protein
VRETDEYGAYDLQEENAAEMDMRGRFQADT